MTGTFFRYNVLALGIFAAILCQSCTNHVTTKEPEKKQTAALIDSSETQGLNDTVRKVVYHDSIFHVEASNCQNWGTIFLKYGRYTGMIDSVYLDYLSEFYLLTDNHQLVEKRYYQLGDRLFVAFYSDLTRDRSLDEFRMAGESLKYVRSWGISRDALFIYPKCNVIINTKTYMVEDGFLDVYIKKENYRTFHKIEKKLPKADSFDLYSFGSDSIHNHRAAMKIIAALKLK